MASLSASAGVKAAFEVVDPDAISETLRCPVCMDVFDDPVFCGGRPCQHVFCLVCVERALEQNGQCPSCRAEMDEDDLQPHQVIRSLLDEVIVRCGRACGWTGRRDAAPAHLSDCPLALLEAERAKVAEFADVSTRLAQQEARIRELDACVNDRDQKLIIMGREMVAKEVQFRGLEERLEKVNGENRLLRRQLADAEQELRQRGELDVSGVACWNDPAGFTHPVGFTADDRDEGDSVLVASSWDSMGLRTPRDDQEREDMARAAAQAVIRDSSSDRDRIGLLAARLTNSTPPPQTVETMLIHLETYREDFQAEAGDTDPEDLDDDDVELHCWMLLANALLANNGFDVEAADHDDLQL